MKNKWIWILTVFVLIGFIAGFFLFNQEKVMTIEEAKTLISNRYLGESGEVKNIEEKDGEFLAVLDRENGQYQVSIDAYNGETRSLEKIGTAKEADTPKEAEDPEEVKLLSEQQITEQLQAAGYSEISSMNSGSSGEQTIFIVEAEKDDQKSQLKINAETGEILKTTPIEEPDIKILTEEQAKEIALKTLKGSIDDVDFESINDQPYYLVEIETQDDQEAVIQINAITGKSTISWED
jgi:uncharacterized membrane protein YkoI